MKLIAAYVDSRPLEAELFPTSEAELKSSLHLMRTIDRMDKSCFYGRATGFQVWDKKM
jgi:hypothetical protein